MSDTSIDLINATMEDDAWKDTFDKLLEPRPVLRAMNLLKKNVCASYNMNSSVENCSKDSSKGLLGTPNLKLPVPPGRTPKHMGKVVSTPTIKRPISKPFMCSLSPIGTWESLAFCDNQEPASSRESKKRSFHATPINSYIVAEYNAIDQIAKTQSETAKEQNTIMSQLQHAKENAKRKSRKKQVVFKSIREQLQPSTKQPQTENETIIEIGDSLRTSKRRPNSLLMQAKKCRSLEASKQRPKSLLLQSGKWRKTLSVWRHTNGQTQRISKYSNYSNHEDSIINVSAGTVGRRKSVFLQPELQPKISDISFHLDGRDLWEKRVLKHCFQSAIIDFTDFFGIVDMANCRKIGEGAYGEVFCNGFDDITRNSVLKIIPIEGKDLINGEIQKTYEQILPEIVISLELSKLRDNNRRNITSGFVGIKRVFCVKGKYPKPLLNLWEAYDNEKGSENDNPNILPSDQLFIVLELSYGGSDLETFAFNNAEQSYYALQQVIWTLAVGEVSHQFEHRDLHWGNILLNSTTDKHVTYKLDNATLTLPTKGVKTSIIDYTLSRMSFADCCFYNDLSCDEDLFAASGDYQFDIYRMMRDILKNKWETSEPKTNVFWISYVIQKMLQGVMYKNTRTKTHAKYMSKLKALKAIALDFKSALDFAKYLSRIK